MTVLDASAVLALVHDEPGAVVVAQALASARLGAANLAEVIGKMSTRRSTSAVFGGFSQPPAWSSNPSPKRTPSSLARCDRSTEARGCRWAIDAAWL